ncbi:hypothetical protein C1646_503232 [Rhizophagus diaphanus]|nr:hypothetical protein C1646_503232 [Rhizophagus diaphanus] [Rhizophagus sp. MUCL 43196]
MKFTTLACLAILGISTLNEVNAAPIAEIGINNKRDATPSSYDDYYEILLQTICLSLPG